MHESKVLTPMQASRIVILAPDVPGPHPTGPSGHAALRLAQRLVAEGASVDLVVPRDVTHDATGAWRLTHWWEAYRTAGMALHVLPWGDGLDNMLAFRALNWLRERPAPDLLLAMDHRALGAMPLLARQIGMLSAALPIGIVLSGPDGWNQTGPAVAGPARLLRQHLERQAMEGADFLLATHAGLRDWYRATFSDAKPCLVMDGLGLGELTPSEGPVWRLAEGLRDVPQARRLARLLADEQAETSPLAGPLLHMPLPPNIEGPHRDPLEAFLTALDGIKPRLRLDIMPTDPLVAARCSPETVLLLADEAARGLPLAIDAAALGIPMVVLQASTGIPAPTGLAPPVATPLLPWLASREAPPRPLLVIPDPPPLVSVCISHFDRPALLAQTIDSLRAQTWPALEVVLVDDASPSAATRDWLAAQEADFAARGWQIIRNDTELWQSISRNKAARAARGEFILVMDDDNLARPHEVETMVRALLATGADAAGAYQALFEGDDDALKSELPDRVEFFPTGGPADVGLVWNVFGDVNVMFRRAAFEAVGGYTAEPELGCEDYEIGAALNLAGRRLIIIPEALYMYRFSAVNMAKGMSNERLYWSHKRPLRPAMAGRDHATARLLAYVHGCEHSAQQRHGWSYWAGRPFDTALPEYGIYDPATAAGSEFQYQLCVAALRAGDEAPAARLLPGLSRHYPQDGRLIRVMAEAALRRPLDTDLRGEVLTADRRAGTAFAEELVRLLLMRGETEVARGWIEAGLPALRELLPEPAMAEESPA